jgi:hypothetical protein
MPYGLFCAGHSVRNLWRAHVFPKWSPPTVAPNPYMRVPETPPLASDSLGRGSRFGQITRRSRSRKHSLQRPRMEKWWATRTAARASASAIPSAAAPLNCSPRRPTVAPRRSCWRMALQPISWLISSAPRWRLRGPSAWSRAILDRVDPVDESSLSGTIALGRKPLGQLGITHRTNYAVVVVRFR